jgi:hypothetical protein
MPRGIPLSKGEIRRRLQDLRNKTALHATARQHVVLLQQENQELRERLAERDAEVEHLREENRKLTEELAKERDALQKLRELLFAREHPHRTPRARTPVPRTSASYRRSAPDRVTDEQTITLATCPDCGDAVSAPVASRTRITEDIVLSPQPAVTRWTITRHWCRSCGKQVAGTVPGFLRQSRLGPQVLTYVVLAKYRLNLPYGKIRDSLALCFGLTVSEGESARLLEVAAAVVGETWTGILRAVRAGKRVHCDETGWSIDGERAWVHTAATESAVLYEIAPTRGKGVMGDMLGAHFSGTRITDALPNDRNLPGAHQLCWAHLTREAGENAARQPGNEERQTLESVLHALYADLRDVTGAQTWSERRALRVRRRCDRQVQRLLQRTWIDPASRLLTARLRSFRSALFTCLTEEGIPPDNNHAERCLRKLVVQRKISGGNRSPTHAVIHARMMSVLETMRLEGGDLVGNLQALFSSQIAELSRQ